MDKGLRTAVHGPLPPFRGPPSPAGDGIRFDVLLEEAKRRDVFRLEAQSDCPQGWDPTRKILCAECRNAAAGGEVSLLTVVGLITFSGALKPKYIPQRLPHGPLPALRATFSGDAPDIPRFAPVRGDGFERPLGEAVSAAD